MKIEGVAPVELKESQIMTEEQKSIRNEKINFLRNLGVYVELYSDTSKLLVYYKDTEYNYISDSTEAQKLVMCNKPLPQELLDRLAYYKPIVDKILDK